ncbi:Kinesin-like protein [Phytophthora palmivora]|uniref:Kinesin-like protein n=1 Tax=Phytophthora palmivora TaxID=4796 RepID=A0A2P4XK09_9STRA|nr:Kinesin-like protein [Phytophthora palmivora]
MLIEEKSEVEKVKIQLDRARERTRLELEAALADASTANRDLENSKMLLQQQLDAMTADLKQREDQAQQAENAFAQLKVEIIHLEEANQKTVSQLRDTRDELKEVTQHTAQMHKDISDRDIAIDHLKRSEAAITTEKLLLEQKLEESSSSIKQLEKNAEVSAQNHLEAMKSLKCKAEEEEHKLAEDFEKQLRVKDELLHQLQAEFDDHRAKVNENDRLHSLMLEEKETVLTALRRQIGDQEQNAKLALEEIQEKLSKALANVSELSEEKNKVELEHASAVQECEALHNGIETLRTEKEAMVSEIQSLSERTEQLTMTVKEVNDQNAKLQMKCEQHQAQLSESEEVIKKFTQEIEELQKQNTLQLNEVAELSQNLASAQEANRQAVITHVDELASSTKKIEMLQQELGANKSTVEDLSDKLEKAEGTIRDAESTASHQQEEIRMYKGIQSTLRDELKKLEFDRLELTESLKTEQESKQDVEQKFVEAREEWMEEKKKIGQLSQESISALEKRVDQLAVNVETLSTQKHELEQENESLNTLVAEQDRKMQELEDVFVDRENKIGVLEASINGSAVAQSQLAGTVAELRSNILDLERQLERLQKTASKQESELTEKETVILKRDDIIASLKVRAQSDEAAWDLKSREYKAELEAAYGRVQAFDQLIEEKTAVFAKAKEALVAEKRSLQHRIEEGEEILAQQTSQLMQEIKQLGLTIEEKDIQLRLANESVADLKDRLVRAAENDGSAKVKELQAAMVELESKHKTVEAENVSLKKTKSELKIREEELTRRSNENGVAEEHIKSIRKALEAQQAAADSALKEAKAKAVSEDVLGQVKRKFLTEKVKMQREIQTLTKKFETVSKENEKLVGHHNSRQKIQHHVKVKEENNRLLDQVRQLSDEKSFMSSLLDVAKAMNAEAASDSATLSLVDVAKGENAENGSKALTLVDVAKQTHAPRQTLHQLAQEIEKEDRSRIQVNLESTAKKVSLERQELRSQTIKQAVVAVTQEEEQVAQILLEKVDERKHEVTDLDSNKENNGDDDGDDGYSSFEDDDGTPTKNSKKQKDTVTTAGTNDEEETYDPPPRTTPSESKESKEFLRAVYRADKYQVRDMLASEVVDANVADQHGWSGLHWAASQNHDDILKLLLQNGCEVNAIDQVRPSVCLSILPLNILFT